ncbi:unnamed protein product [Dracunculus medinensis]|uniref:Gag-pol polyprotein n=1 Tax=Dracunculus medinensis TaxID=318479 RepID=A0A0N4U815_DRAME|nr:unnamed protein product [Dracunculus medinensis]
MLMARYNMVQQNGGPQSSIPSTSQRIARPLRRPQIPQKPVLPNYGPRPIGQICKNDVIGLSKWAISSPVDAVEILGKGQEIAKPVLSRSTCSLNRCA